MFNSDPTDRINNVVKAIAFAEGCIFQDQSYNTHSLAYRHNNPCDLKHAPDGFHAVSDGSVHGILAFKSLGDGWNAGYRQVALMATGISAVYNQHMTFEQIADHYARENDTPKERVIAEDWAKNVGLFLNIPPNTTLDDYLHDRMVVPSVELSKAEIAAGVAQNETTSQNASQTTTQITPAKPAPSPLFNKPETTVVEQKPITPAVPAQISKDEIKSKDNTNV